MNTEQGELLTKATRSLEAARVLLQTGFPEFAASRAYYTMFYVAEAFLEGEGLSYSKHSAVISAFGQQFARTNRVPTELHRILIEAEQIRRRGDYQNQITISEDQASELIEQAQQFLSAGLKQIRDGLSEN